LNSFRSSAIKDMRGITGKLEQAPENLAATANASSGRWRLFLPERTAVCVPPHMLMRPWMPAVEMEDEVDCGKTI